MTAAPLRDGEYNDAAGAKGYIERPSSGSAEGRVTPSPSGEVAARRRRWWGRVSWRGFYLGVRIGDGAFQCGVKVLRDRSRHYATVRHPEYGIALWWRRSRLGDRGYPHTFALKVVIA